jgi:hypothetical protein
MIEVAIMESAMAPMITASILAATHGLKPSFSMMMIGWNPYFFITLAFWYFVLRFLFIYFFFFFIRYEYYF